jgi:uncharacterized protein (TIGR02594 family)
MSKVRIYTDVTPGADENFLLAQIKADGGTAVTHRESDGRLTVVATLPSRAQTPSPRSNGPAAGWMEVAERERGVEELRGAASNPRVEAYHATTGKDEAGDDVPWCSSFVNFCITEAGLRGTSSRLARSWATWGVDAGALVPGCVVVLKRGDPPKGHVGFFVGMDGRRVRLLGGNQGDKVSIASFDADRVVARRLPA